MADVEPFLDHVLRGRNVPPGAPARGGAPLRTVRRREPDQRAEPGAARGDPGRARRSRTAPAALLGQQELAPLPRRHPPRDGGGRRPAGARLRHLGIQLLLRVPAVPRGPRAGAGRGRPDRAHRRQAPRLPRPPGLRRGQRRSRAGGARHACRRLDAKRRGSRSPLTASRPRWPPAPTTSRSCAKRARWSRRPCRTRRGRCVYQSRSGPPHQPWLEPDILEHLDALRDEGVEDVVVAPIGFVSDHMEVVHDLDSEARERAAALGLGFARAGTAGTHPAFVRMVRELVVERVSGGERRALGARGPRADTCAPDCSSVQGGRPADPGRRSAPSRALALDPSGEDQGHQPGRHERGHAQEPAHQRPAHPARASPRG